MTLDLAAIGLRPAGPASQPEARQSLGQQDFLTLLVAQLRNQDPLNPLDNETFVAQLAQFSTVSGITEMNESLSRIADRASADSRALAPQWIGRTVVGQDGQSGVVQFVSIAADSSLQLGLDNGQTLPVASVASLA